jgi:hypothetical protein
LTIDLERYSYAIWEKEAAMVKARSPGYPTIGLRESIEKVRQVYEKDYQNKIPRKLVAEHMGYRSLNGKSLGVLSAVTKYGLLEGRAEANWVSDLALAIIAHEPGTPERAKAIAEAASRPELFADLDSKFQGGKVSDAAVRSYLMTKKFIPQAADAAIRAYRETKDLVNEEAGGYSPGHGTLVEPEPASMPPAPNAESGVRSSISPSAMPGVIFGEKELLRGPLSPNSTYRLMVSGAVGAKELGKIIKLLTLYKELYAEDGAEEERAPEE